MLRVWHVYDVFCRMRRVTMTPVTFKGRGRAFVLGVMLFGFAYAKPLNLHFDVDHYDRIGKQELGYVQNDAPALDFSSFFTPKCIYL